MPEAKYILSAVGGGDAISVYDDADLDQRLEAARQRGVEVNVRPVDDGVPLPCDLEGVGDDGGGQ